MKSPIPAVSVVTGVLLTALVFLPASVTAQDVDLRNVGYERGDPDAPVKVIEFGDFGCTACGQFARETLGAIHDEFVATGKVHWRYVPFIAGLPRGPESTRAAECAAEQNAFWPMHDRLFADQKEWIRGGKLRERFTTYARDLGLDAVRFDSCYRENRGKQRTNRNNDVARELRVAATPTFFINGHMVRGALPIETFREILLSAGAR